MRNLNVALSDETAASFDAFPPDTQTQIQQQINAFATASINQRKADDEGLDGVDVEEAIWWDALTPEQQETERAALARGLADIDAGRTRPFEALDTRIRAMIAERAAGTAHEAV